MGRGEKGKERKGGRGEGEVKKRKGRAGTRSSFERN